MGDHTETLEIDYDPAQISYADLLEIFWKSHDPTARAWSSQYKAAIFVHNEEQRNQAESTRDQMTVDRTGTIFRRKVRTEILPAETFYLAEDYHHKYMVQGRHELWDEILQIYPQPLDWINSTAAARLNGYLGGYGSKVQLEEEIDSLGLSVGAQEYLRKTVRR